MLNDNFLHQMTIFYIKWWFLEIGVFGSLIILWKCHSWTESIQVEQQKEKQESIRLIFIEGYLFDVSEMKRLDKIRISCDVVP